MALLLTWGPEAAATMAPCPHAPSPVPRCHTAQPSDTEAHGPSPRLDTPPLCTQTSGPSCPRGVSARLPTPPLSGHLTPPFQGPRSEQQERGGVSSMRPGQKEDWTVELGREGCGPGLYSS